jgi:hypothetical protein
MSICRFMRLQMKKVTGLRDKATISLLDIMALSTVQTHLIGVQDLGIIRRGRESLKGNLQQRLKMGRLSHRKCDTSCSP